MNRRDFIYAASAGAASAAVPTITIAQGAAEARKDVPQGGAKLKTITLEEHFASPGWSAGPGRAFMERMRHAGPPGRLKVLEQVQDVGETRIGEMDAAGIDVQVLSLTSPGVEQADAAEQVAIATESNDFVAEAVKKYPKRFAAFAALPVSTSDKAADELDRRVKQGFKGTLINGHSRGRYLDDKFFWPILERAEALNVPIYLHPTVPAKPVVDVLYSGFSPDVNAMFEAAGWGWHIETGVHLVRMVLGGVFDRYPKLQVVVGHLGEGVPFMLERLNRNMPTRLTKLERPLGAYLRQNVHYTFAGFNFTATFLDLLLEVGVDRIMFSCDHPFASMAEARAFLDHIPVSTADRERIAHGNAERLFNL